MDNKNQKDKELKQQVIQLLQAASQGDKKATQMIKQIVAKAQKGDSDAMKIYKTIQEVMNEAKGAQQQTSQQALAAKHGAKLQYIKQLKHLCNDDEELVYYYKKGGQVGCGCVGKKLEDGGKAQENDAVTKFKRNTFRGNVNKAAKKVVNSTQKAVKEVANKETEEERNKRLEWKVSGKNTSTSPEYAEYDKCGSKIKKHNNGGSLKQSPFHRKISNWRIY